MTDILLWVLVGAFIGWNLPQPFWAKWLQNKIVNVVRRVKVTNEN